MPGEQGSAQAATIASEERLRVIGETARLIGHDLRNPLQAILNLAYIARARIRSKGGLGLKEGEDFLDKIGELVRYMDKVVTDLQDYADPPSPRPVPVNPSDLVRRCVQEARLPGRIRPVLDGDRLAPVQMDPVMVGRALGNIIRNAAQAMPDGGVLTIKGRLEGDALLLGIIDTGPGIPEADMDHLFEPLFTTRCSGQGMGLAASRRLVEACGGTISVSTAKGRGSTFVILLPRAGPPTFSAPGRPTIREGPPIMGTAGQNPALEDVPR